MMMMMLDMDSAGDMAGGSTTYQDMTFIERVIEVTHCRDRRLVSEICAEAGYFDLDQVCSHVLAFMDGVRSSSSSTTSDAELTVDILSNSTSSASAGAVAGAGSASGNMAAAGAKPKSRATRRQRKQEKKARAAQRHQAAVVANVMTAAATETDNARCHGRLTVSSDEDDSGPFVITQQIKVLQI